MIWLRLRRLWRAKNICPLRFARGRSPQSRLSGTASALTLQFAIDQVTSRKSSYAKIGRLPRCPVLSLGRILASLSTYATKRVPTLITLLVGTLHADGANQSRNENSPPNGTMQTNKRFQQQRLASKITKIV